MRPPHFRQRVMSIAKTRARSWAHAMRRGRGEEAGEEASGASPPARAARRARPAVSRRSPGAPPAGPGTTTPIVGNPPSAGARQWSLWLAQLREPTSAITAALRKRTPTSQISLAPSATTARPLRAAALRADRDRLAAEASLTFLAGLLQLLRQSGYGGLVVVLDEVETIQRMNSQTREKSLNALRHRVVVRRPALSTDLTRSEGVRLPGTDASMQVAMVDYSAILSPSLSWGANVAALTASARQTPSASLTAGTARVTSPSLPIAYSIVIGGSFTALCCLRQAAADLRTCLSGSAGLSVGDLGGFGSTAGMSEGTGSTTPVVPGSGGSGTGGSGTGGTTTGVGVGGARLGAAATVTPDRAQIPPHRLCQAPQYSPRCPNYHF